MILPENIIKCNYPQILKIILKKVISSNNNNNNSYSISRILIVEKNLDSYHPNKI